VTTISLAAKRQRRITNPLISLARLGRVLSAAPDTESLLQLALREAIRVTKASCGSIILLNPQPSPLSPIPLPASKPALVGEGAGAKASEHDPEAGIESHRVVQGCPAPLQAQDRLQDRVIASGETLLITDTQQDGQNGRLSHADVRSVLVVPLRAGESEASVIGLLHLHSSLEDAFSPDLVRYSEALAAQVALVVGYARRYQELEHVAEARMRELGQANRALTWERSRLETLLRITSELSISLDLDLVLNRTLSLLKAAVGAHEGAIFLVNPVTSGEHWAVGSDPWAMNHGQALAQWVTEQHQAAIVPDLSRDPRWQNDERGQPVQEHPQLRSGLAVPLIATGDVLGVLMLLHSQPDAFSDEDLRLVKAAANQVAVAINNAELYRLIRDQAERLGRMLREQHVEATKNRAILEGVADGVMVVDVEGRITLLNAAAERILGLGRREMLYRSTDEFLGLLGGGARSWAEAITRWAHGPVPHQEGTFLAERLDIEGRTVSVHLAPVFLGDEFIGSVSVFRDISKEVEVDRLKSDFVSTASHELRTPMTAIKGYADLLLLGAGGPLTEQQRKFLTIIQSNADRLMLLIYDLLDLSRIETGRIGLNPKPVHLDEVIRRVIAILNGRKAQEGKDIRIEVEVAPDLPLVLVDETRVTQILTNLVDNAYNYTLPGGQITIRARPLEGAVEVSVADTGIGISREELTHIFERFYRADHPVVQRTPGTGLGLAIVKHLVELHNGHVWVESEPDKGSTFRFLLPIA